jgi:hypothetical protein
VSINLISRNNKNIEFVPISVQNGIDLISAPVWTMFFGATLRHPVPLILPIQDGSHLIPINDIPLGSYIFLDEAIAPRGVLEYPGTG